MRYRRKPTEVEAYQLTKQAIFNKLAHGAPLPGVDVTSATYNKEQGSLWSSHQHVVTMQGREVPVEPGEWIVKEPDGVHYYPIADDEFRRIYEPVE